MLVDTRCRRPRFSLREPPFYELGCSQRAEVVHCHCLLLALPVSRWILETGVWASCSAPPLHYRYGVIEVRWISQQSKQTCETFERLQLYLLCGLTGLDRCQSMDLGLQQGWSLWGFAVTEIPDSSGSFGQQDGLATLWGWIRCSCSQGSRCSYDLMGRPFSASWCSVVSYLPCC